MSLRGGIGRYVPVGGLHERSGRQIIRGITDGGCVRRSGTCRPLYFQAAKQHVGAYPLIASIACTEQSITETNPSAAADTNTISQSISSAFTGKSSNSATHAIYRSSGGLHLPHRGGIRRDCHVLPNRSAHSTYGSNSIPKHSQIQRGSISNSRDGYGASSKRGLYSQRRAVSKYDHMHSIQQEKNYGISHQKAPAQYIQNSIPNTLTSYEVFDQNWPSNKYYHNQYQKTPCGSQQDDYYQSYGSSCNLGYHQSSSKRARYSQRPPISKYNHKHSIQQERNCGISSLAHSYSTPKTKTWNSTFGHNWSSNAYYHSQYKTSRQNECYQSFGENCTLQNSAGSRVIHGNNYSTHTHVEIRQIRTVGHCLILKKDATLLKDLL